VTMNVADDEGYSMKALCTLYWIYVFLLLSLGRYLYRWTISSAMVSFAQQRVLFALI